MKNCMPWCKIYGLRSEYNLAMMTRFFFLLMTLTFLTCLEYACTPTYFISSRIETKEIPFHPEASDNSFRFGTFGCVHHMQIDITHSVFSSDNQALTIEGQFKALGPIPYGSLMMGDYHYPAGGSGRPKDYFIYVKEEIPLAVDNNGLFSITIPCEQIQSFYLFFYCAGFKPYRLVIPPHLCS